MNRRTFLKTVPAFTVLAGTASSFAQTIQTIYLTDIEVSLYNICVASANGRFRHSTIRGRVHKDTSQQGGRPTISFL
jgi:hypothetical protein